MHAALDNIKGDIPDADFTRLCLFMTIYIMLHVSGTNAPYCTGDINTIIQYITDPDACENLDVKFGDGIAISFKKRYLGMIHDDQVSRCIYNVLNAIPDELCLMDLSLLDNMMTSIA